MRQTRYITALPGLTPVVTSAHKMYFTIKKCLNKEGKAVLIQYYSGDTVIIWGFING
jgi:hypothetical protein